MALSLPYPELPGLPSLPGLDQTTSRQRQPPPTLTEEERKSLLGSVVGGLAAIGGAIDRPFAATRGTVAAVGDVLRGDTKKAGEHLQQLKYLLPLPTSWAEKIGIDMPEEHVWGREVLESFGVRKNKETGIKGWWNGDSWLDMDLAEAGLDLAGVATDLLLVPPMLPGGGLTAKGLGALKQSGKVMRELDTLRAAGKFEEAAALAAKISKQTIEAKTAAEMPVRTMIGGSAAQKIGQVAREERGIMLKPTHGPLGAAAKALFGEAGIPLFTGKKTAETLDWLAYKSKVAPVVRSMFGATTEGAQTGALQRGVEQAYDEIEKAQVLMGMYPHIQAESDDLGRLFETFAKDADIAGHPAGTLSWQEMQRLVAEKQSLITEGARATEQEIREMITVAPNKTEAAKKINEFSRRMVKLQYGAMADIQDALYKLDGQLGGRVPELVDMYAGHYGRHSGYMMAQRGERTQAGKRLEQSLAREDPFRDAPGGAWMVNQFYSNSITTRPIAEKTLKEWSGSTADFARDMGATAEGYEGVGRVIGVKGDEALVHFHGAGGGIVEATVPLKKLRPADPTMASMMPGKPLTRAQQVEEATIWLEAAGIEVPKKNDDIIEAYAREFLMKDTANREIDARIATGVQPKAKPWIELDAPLADNWERERQRVLYGVEQLIKETPKGKQYVAAEAAPSAVKELLSKSQKAYASHPGIFNRTTIEDHFTDVYRAAEHIKSLMGQHHFLEGVATETEGKGYISLNTLWENMHEALGDKAMTPKGLDTLVDSLRAKMKSPGATADSLFVPPETQKAMEFFTKAAIPGSDERFALGHMWDWWTDISRAGLTLPWPAYHSRNFVSGQVQNLAGDVPFKLREYMRNLRAVRRWIAGKGDYKYAQELMENGALQNAMITDVLQSQKEAAAKIPQGGIWGAIFGGEAEKAAWRQATTGGKLKRLAWGPIDAGKRAQAWVETMNRAPLYGAAREAGYTPQQALELVKRLQYDYCVDETTEILTRRGWMKWNEVRPGHKALSIDPVTRHIVWSRIEEVNIFDSPGTLTRWKSSRLDALTTNRHSWLFEGSGQRGGHYTLPKAPTHFRTTQDAMNRKGRLVAGGGIVDHAPKTPTYEDELVELVGWYVTEGSTCATNCGITVAQSRRHNSGHIATLERLQKHFVSQGHTATQHSDRDMGWGPIATFYFGKGVGNVVRQIAPQKSITTRFLLSLTERQLRLFAQTLMDGDGTCEGFPGQLRGSWGQKDPARCDAFQFLMALLGYRTHNREDTTNSGCRTVRIYQSPHVYVERGNLAAEEEPYEGKVWCPTTKTGTWMARRNGVTYWTGNSKLTPFERKVARRGFLFYGWLKQNSTYQFSEIFTNPGGKHASLIRMAAIAGRQSGDLPKWLQEQMAIMLPSWKNKPEETTLLRSFGLTIDDLRDIQSTTGGTARRMIARMHPLVGLMYRLITDKEPYSNRKLDDVYSPTGIRPLDALVQATPASRVVWSWLQARDTRKHILLRALNMLTGLQIGTYDLPAMRLNDLRGAFQTRVAARPYVRIFETPYIPKGKKAEAGPEAARELRKLGALTQEWNIEQRKRANQPKKEKPSPFLDALYSGLFG